MAGRYPSKAVANWFIERFDESGQPITQLQLNKLVYIAHGWHMAIGDSEGLISERIVAWKYGPVVPSLRDEFREFGAAPIDRLADEFVGGDGPSVVPKLGDELPEPWEIRVLEFVFTRYSHLNGPQLIELTHQPDSPWSIVTKNGLLLINQPIPNGIIKEHYLGKLRAHAM